MGGGLLRNISTCSSTPQWYPPLMSPINLDLAYHHYVVTSDEQLLNVTRQTLRVYGWRGGVSHNVRGGLVLMP